MTIVLTEQVVLDTLREIVAEKPDYVYAGPKDASGMAHCAYSAPDGSPSCLVGHLFARLIPEQFAQIHDEEWSGSDFYPTDDASGVVGSMEGVEFDRGSTASLLDTAQLAQDGGKPWGQALEHAVKHTAYWRDQTEDEGDNT